MSGLGVSVGVQADFSSVVQAAAVAEAKIEQLGGATATAASKMQAGMEAAQAKVVQFGGAAAGAQREVQGTAAAVKEVTAAATAAGRALESAAAAVDRVGDEFDAAKAKAKQFADVANDNRNSFAPKLQQIGYQVGDFATQVAAGTPVLTAFAQQGSQLAGIFGPGGAVLGAIIAVTSAIGGGLVRAFTDVDDAAEEAKAATFEFKSALDFLNATTRESRDAIDQLLAKFREAGGQAQILTKLNLTQQTTDLKAQIAAQRAEVEAAIKAANLDQLIAQLRPPVGMEPAPEDLPVQRLLDSIEAAVKKFRSGGSLADLASELRAITDKAAALGNQDPGLGNLAKGILQAATDAAVLEKQLADTERRLDSLQSPSKVPISARDGGPLPVIPIPVAKDDQLGLQVEDATIRAAERAAKERERLGEQLQTKLEQLEAKTAAAVEKRQREEVQAARESYRAQVEYADALAEYLQQLYEQDRQRREEAIATDPFAGLLGGLADYAREATALGDQVRDTVRDAFKGAEDALVEFVMTGKLSIEDLARTIEEDLARTAIRQLTGYLAKSLFGALGGSSYQPGAAANADGNAFVGGAVVPFAVGGVVDRPTFFPMANGGIGLIGEAGPEAIMPLRRDASGKLGVAASGGGGEVNVTVIDQRGSGSPPVEISRKGTGRDLQILLKGQVEQALAGGEFDRILNNRFGLRPAAR